MDGGAKVEVERGKEGRGWRDRGRQARPIIKGGGMETLGGNNRGEGPKC